MSQHAGILALLCVLLPPWTAALAQEPAPEIPLPRKNYLNNGGFERGAEGWAWFAGREAGGVVKEDAHGGGACLRVTGAIGDHRYFEQPGVPLTPGRTYTLSAWVKCKGFQRAGPNSQVVNVANFGWTKGASISPTKPDQEWTRHSVTFEAPPTEEVAGRPDYRLVIFWPVQSEGTLWIDDVQVEEAAEATEFSDCYLGWAFEILSCLRAARRGAEDAKTALSGRLASFPLARDLTAQAAGAAAKADALSERLKGYAGLAPDQAKALLAEAQDLQKSVASLRTLTFLGNPYVPLSEAPLPAAIPGDLALSWTCLYGEKRAVAVNIANLTGRSGTCRFAPGELVDDRGTRLPGVPWVTAYSVPEIRGSVKPAALFTDPMPRVDEAGCIPVRSEGLTQVVLLVDTSRLPPGRYRGSAELASLEDAGDRRTLSVDLTVLPVRLPSLADKDISDIGQLDDTARESIGPLGINTFTVPAQWLVPEFDPTGTGKARVDLTRVDLLVKDRLARCPEARFLLCFGVGAVISNHLKKVYQLSPEAPLFRTFAANWVRAVVEHFRSLGVPPERLVFETVDEPGVGQLPEAALWAEIIRETAPGARTQSFVTSFHAEDEASTRLYETHSITAPAFSCINEGVVKHLKAKGKQVWVYDCQSSAETFHPLAYYRLLPWLAWRHGLDGWGHFSWLASERGRGYVPWEGVAKESLVYPNASGGQVISRRWLALLAGTQDYQALRALDRLVRAARQRPGGAEAAAAAETLLADLPPKALALLRPGKRYFTALAPGADPGTLDRFREQTVAAARDLVAKLGAAPPLGASLEGAGEKTLLVVDSPGPAEVTVRYLCDRRLPWRTLGASVPAGKSRVPVRLGPGERVTRCLVAAAGDDGRVAVAALPPVPRIEVDSTVPPYEPDRLNDGLAVPGMKFEPEHGWISGGAAAEHWVVASFDAPVRLGGVRLWWMTFYGLPQAYRVQAWLEGGWKDVPGFTGWRPAQSAVEEVTFSPLTTEKLRIVQKAGGGNHTFPNLMGLSEVEPF